MEPTIDGEERMRNKQNPLNRRYGRSARDETFQYSVMVLAYPLSESVPLVFILGAASAFAWFEQVG